MESSFIRDIYFTQTKNYNSVLLMKINEAGRLY